MQQQTTGSNATNTPAAATQKPKEYDQDDVLNRNIVFQEDIKIFISTYKSSKNQLVTNLIEYLNQMVVIKFNESIGRLLSRTKSRLIELNIPQNLKNKDFYQAFYALNAILEKPKYNTYQILCEYEERFKLLYGEVCDNVRAQFTNEKKRLKEERNTLQAEAEKQSKALKECETLLQEKLLEAQEATAALIPAQEALTASNKDKDLLQSNITGIQEEIRYKTNALEATNKKLADTEQQMNANIQVLTQLVKTKEDLIALKEAETQRKEEELVVERNKVTEVEEKLNQTAAELEQSKIEIGNLTQLNYTLQNSSRTEFNITDIKFLLSDAYSTQTKTCLTTTNGAMFSSTQQGTSIKLDDMTKYWSQARVCLMKELCKLFFLNDIPNLKAEDRSFLKFQIEALFEEQPFIEIISQLQQMKFNSSALQDKVTQIIASAKNFHNKDQCLWTRDKYARIDVELTLKNNQNTGFTQIHITNKARRQAKIAKILGLSTNEIYQEKFTLLHELSKGTHHQLVSSAAV